MTTILLVSHILITVALIACILLQTSKGGLGSAWGGGEFYRTKRGAEKILFLATIFFAVLFFVTSIASLIIRA
ncbi:preprotein translocase subunit SecG [Candidatus Gottesmanbacteria bacterium]|nr:preprotein translocase subunit SecG [Candidatus Gottesmanbacteria bacterium]